MNCNILRTLLKGTGPVYSSVLGDIDKAEKMNCNILRTLRGPAWGCQRDGTHENCCK